MTVEKNRLKWGCRRGLLELDIILERFLEKDDPRGLEELLELPDNDLWDIVSGRSDRYDGRFEAIVARLRAS